MAVFRLNAFPHPDSANVRGSLGEGLVAVGDLDAASASYRRSLGLNPANRNAAEMIGKIENQR